MKIVDITKILENEDRYVTTIKTPNIDPETMKSEPYYIDRYVNMLDLLELPDVKLNMFPHWVKDSVKKPAEDGPYLVTYTGEDAATGVEFYQSARGGWMSMKEVYAWAQFPSGYRENRPEQAPQQ